MKTPYRGRATIGGHPTVVDILNVDVQRWKGVATLIGVVPDSDEEVVRLLDQPRPGWNSRAAVTTDTEGVVQLEGLGQFFAPRSVPPPGRQSLWVRKPPPAT